MDSALRKDFLAFLDADMRRPVFATLALFDPPACWRIWRRIWRGGR